MAPTLRIAQIGIGVIAALLLFVSFISKAPPVQAAPQDCSALVAQLDAALRAGGDITGKLAAGRACAGAPAPASGGSSQSQAQTQGVETVQPLVQVQTPLLPTVLATFGGPILPGNFAACMYFNSNGTVLGALGSAVVTGTFIGDPSLITFFTFGSPVITNGWGFTVGPWSWLWFTQFPGNYSSQGHTSNCNVATGV